jgi:hypothetical protein
MKTSFTPTKKMHCDSMLLHTFPALCSSYMPKGLAQDEFCVSHNWIYTGSTMYVYIKQSPAEIQTPTHWNLIRPRMTTPPPVVTPSSDFLPPSTDWLFIHTMKNLAQIWKGYFYVLNFFKKLRVSNYITWNCVSNGVSVHFNRTQNLRMVKQKRE